MHAKEISDRLQPDRKPPVCFHAFVLSYYVVCLLTPTVVLQPALVGPPPRPALYRGTAIAAAARRVARLVDA